MEWIVLLFVLVLLVLIKKPERHGFTYTKRGPLFSAAESSFYRVLDQAISDQYRIFGKVRVADILSPTKGMNRKNWQIAFNKISAKHFDFVLCSKGRFEVVAAIELDDKSHNTKKAKLRDSILENACKTADLTLVRFKARSGYKVEAVRQHIAKELSSREY